VTVVNAHERRIEQLEHEVADAERRVASQRQRVYGGKRPFDPYREAELQRSLEGASERLELERRRGTGGA
jgi:tRNA 2-selenouridine synthase SelU